MDVWNHRLLARQDAMLEPYYSIQNGEHDSTSTFNSAGRYTVRLVLSQQIATWGLLPQIAQLN